MTEDRSQICLLVPLGRTEVLRVMYSRISPLPRKRACWGQSAAQWVDCTQSRTTLLSAMMLMMMLTIMLVMMKKRMMMTTMVMMMMTTTTMVVMMIIICTKTARRLGSFIAAYPEAFFYTQVVVSCLLKAPAKCRVYSRDGSAEASF